MKKQESMQYVLAIAAIVVIVALVLFVSGNFASDTEDVSGQAVRARDSDGDGVPNRYDVCPGYNDRHDLDNDGVPDGCDDSDADGLTDYEEVQSGTDPLIADVSSACTDTESPTDFGIHGTVTVDSVVYQDSCVGDLLLEYSCSADVVVEEEYTCLDGCDHGVCV